MSMEQKLTQNNDQQPETPEQEVPAEKKKLTLEQETSIIKSNRGNAGQAKEMAEYWGKKIAIEEDEIKKQEELKIELEAGGIDVGPDSDFAKKMADSKEYLAELSQNKVQDEEKFRKYNKISDTEINPEVKDKIQVEANWENVCDTIADIIHNKTLRLKSEKQSQIYDNLLYWAPRVKSVDEFNNMIERFCQGEKRTIEAMKDPRVQETFRIYFETREPAI